eukprot:683209-Heterocapsa_arctica.AAC.1
MRYGGVRIDTLTTREIMEYRIIRDQGIGYTIPPWARHLNTGTCQFCYCKDYVGLLGFDTFCTNCETQGLVFGWQMLK